MTKKILAFTVALFASIAMALGQSAPIFDLSQGWSSAEFVQGGSTSVIVLKELAGYNPFVPSPKAYVKLPGWVTSIRLSASTFGGYDTVSKGGVAGLAGTLGGSISGNLGWSAGIGQKVDFSKPITLATFNIREIGGVFGVTYKTKF